MKTQPDNHVKARSMKMIRHYTSFLVLLLTCSGAQTAETGTDKTVEEVTASIVELSGGVGYYNFDPARKLDDAAMASIGLGLHFSRRWAVLLHYAALNSTLHTEPHSQKVDVQKYQIDVHRFFNTQARLRPYLVGGFGQMDVIYDGYQSNENRYNLGAGLAWKMTSSWTVRADIRSYLDRFSNYNENAFTLTFGYRFYGGEKDR